MLPAADYARSGYSLPENHPPDIFEDNIFPGIWTKVFEKPSNRYLEGDFYIVYVRDRVLVLFRAKKKHSKEVSLYEPIGTDKEGNEINLLDVIESAPVDIVEDCYIRENTDYLLRSLKKVLSDKEYQVICCRYGLFGMEEETQREIARKLCISRSYVSRIEKTALQKLRGLFPQMQ